jgi:hypothetical protein
MAAETTLQTAVLIVTRHPIPQLLIRCAYSLLCIHLQDRMIAAPLAIAVLRRIAVGDLHGRKEG